MTDILWQPSTAQKEASCLNDYRNYIAEEGYGRFADYDDLWRWSVTELDAFWGSVWCLPT